MYYKIAKHKKAVKGVIIGAACVITAAIICGAFNHSMSDSDKNSTPSTQEVTQDGTDPNTTSPQQPPAAQVEDESANNPKPSDYNISNGDSKSVDDSEPNNSSESSSSPKPYNDSTQSDDTKQNSSPKSCLHFEAGRCWDELEDEAYSAGLYDQQYGRYGASVYYDESCDSICQDILDDAYDEGWYDRY